MLGRSHGETERVRYLLGLASPAEREHVESEYFHDADAFQRMLAAEDDLVDAYARGELSDEERRRFEKRFLKSSQGKDRVQFSRAFTRAVRPVRSRRWDTVRIAAVAAVFVIAVVLSWLVIDRRRMSNELRDLRAAHEQLTKETESLRRAEQQHIAEVQPQPNALQPANPTPRKTIPSQTQREPRAPTPLYKESLQAFRVITTTEAERLEDRSDATLPPKSQPVTGPSTPEPKPGSDTVAVAAGSDEMLVNRNDTSLGNRFESRRITQLPLEAKNVPSLLTLQPRTTRDGAVVGSREDQANITLDGVDLSVTSTVGRKFEDLLTLTPGVSITNNFLLLPHGPSGGTVIEVAESPAWLRLRLVLETSLGYTDYRATIRTAKGRYVMSMEWIEPITDQQNLIETPTVKTANLPAGNYKLILDGKKDNGSFVPVAEYSFKVVVKK